MRHKQDRRLNKCKRSHHGYRSWYSTKRWIAAAHRFRTENPLCVQCLDESIVKPAEAVDHIVPHAGDLELFWDPANWQSLCWSHHSKKTTRERARAS